MESHLRRRFGGFTSISWKKQSQGRSYYQGDADNEIDEKAFLFSLNKKKKFSAVEVDSSHIRSNLNYGPTFGMTDLYLSNDCAANFQSSSILGSSYERDAGAGNETTTILAGHKNFLVMALEVYSVEFINN